MKLIVEMDVFASADRPCPPGYVRLVVPFPSCDLVRVIDLTQYEELRAYPPFEAVYLVDIPHKYLTVLFYIGQHMMWGGRMYYYLPQNTSGREFIRLRTRLYQFRFAPHVIRRSWAMLMTNEFDRYLPPLRGNELRTLYIIDPLSSPQQQEQSRLSQA